MERAWERRSGAQGPNVPRRVRPTPASHPRAARDHYTEGVHAGIGTADSVETPSNSLSTLSPDASGVQRALYAETHGECRTSNSVTFLGRFPSLPLGATRADHRRGNATRADHRRGN